jgi:hypothetical protein
MSNREGIQAMHSQHAQSPMSAASVSSSARRATPVPATALATAHLGIEESEYDKPTLPAPGPGRR